MERTDPIFCAAFFYFLQERGWSVQEFCDRTKQLSQDGQSRLLHPSSVSDWKKRTHPSNQNVIITCRTLGVSRSELFRVGEELDRLRLERESERRRQKIRLEKDFDAVKQAILSLRQPDDLETVRELDLILHDQRQRIEALSR